MTSAVQGIKCLMCGAPPAPDFKPGVRMSVVAGTLVNVASNSSWNCPNCGTLNKVESGDLTIGEFVGGDKNVVNITNIVGAPTNHVSYPKTPTNCVGSVAHRVCKDPHSGICRLCGSSE